MAQLPRRLSRTRHKQPPELRIPFARLLETQTIPTLENWLVQAQEAIRCRQEAMRANFEQAVAENLKRLWGKVRADPSSLSSEMIQAALGKAPPQQRLWGISGHVPVGVEFTLPPSSLPSALGTLTELSSTQWVQRVMGTEHGLRLWFSGPRRLGDFLLQWSSDAHPLRNTPLKLLQTEIGRAHV